ncbi:MAG: thiamine-phosphate kinase [Syntrophobacteraceae bacterium]|jgi:thiamine-monophosphate kinase|nr:thiamine-phosphate kinase [Syntrophobacteraceae bacterium]
MTDPDAPWGDSPLKVKDIGEFGLIERISRLLPCHAPEVVIGIGDDVAVLKSPSSDYLLATCDCQVESVHFTRDLITPHQLGRRVVAVNVSDIAAMGGEPTWALVSLVLPEETDVGYVDSLYEGMRTQLAQFGGVVVGGNVSRSPDRLMIDFFLLGRVSPGRLLLRSGALPGDVVMVTGHPGDSRAGLECLRRQELKVNPEHRELLLSRHLTPQARLAEGRLLASTGSVHAMADVSDGLVADLRHICRASGTGFRIFAGHLPISPACRGAAEAARGDATEWALSGGEDYELVFTALPESAPGLQRLLQEEAGTPSTIVGEILQDPACSEIVMPDGSIRRLPASSAGWDHFGKSGGP